MKRRFEVVIKDLKNDTEKSVCVYSDEKWIDNGNVLNNPHLDFICKCVTEHLNYIPLY